MITTQFAIHLSPMQRLRLRDSLQDLWQAQVRRITELSIDLHTVLDDGDEALEGGRSVDAIAAAVSAARFELTEVEQAMNRLDERNYGRCCDCLEPMPFEWLLDDPCARRCPGCQSHVGRMLTETRASATAG